MAGLLQPFAALGPQSWQHLVSPQYGKEHKICSLWNQVQDLTLEGLFNMLQTKRGLKISLLC